MIFAAKCGMTAKNEPMSLNNAIRKKVIVCQWQNESAIL